MAINEERVWTALQYEWYMYNAYPEINGPCTVSNKVVILRNEFLMSLKTFKMESENIGKNVLLIPLKRRISTIFLS